MSDSKDTNPKDAIGGDKIPIHLWPEAATVLGCLACLEGATKYGRTNWREAGVKASIYYDALRRHLMKWWEGEDVDTDSGLPHEAHMLACIAIIVDARAHGKFVDDRAYVPVQGVLSLLTKHTPDVARIKTKYADRSPQHYTRLFNVEAGEHVHQGPSQVAPAKAPRREAPQSVPEGNGGLLVLGSDVRPVGGVQVDRVPSQVSIDFSGFDADATALAQRTA